ncbi:type VI protein secretion system component VasF [Neisseria sp. HSC-16F19]|nr:hypothetical protein [Neisseria sp. HSC-16F19]MCP2040176.1 type VI protein secretion system component VasF [Neisseria sp. HSC-16F19]
MSREEQIYYALWVLAAAVAVLLSPFAYVRLRRRSTTAAPWRRIVWVYGLLAAAVAALLYVWLG